MRRIIVTAILFLSILGSLLTTTSAGATPTTAPPAATATATGKDPCAKGDRICWTEHIRKRQNERAWWLEVRAQQIRARDWARFVAWVNAEAARTGLHGYPAPYPIGGGLLMGSGRCGPAWGLPPCKRLQTESRGIINVYYGGCNHQCHPYYTAQGKWAATNGTWGGYGGYRTAALAPEWVQDQFARQLWDGGRGCSHWSACHLR